MMNQSPNPYSNYLVCYLKIHRTWRVKETSWKSTNNPTTPSYGEFLALPVKRNLPGTCGPSPVRCSFSRSCDFLSNWRIVFLCVCVCFPKCLESHPTPGEQQQALIHQRPCATMPSKRYESNLQDPGLEGSGIKKSPWAISCHVTSWQARIRQNPSQKRDARRGSRIPGTT